MNIAFTSSSGNIGKSTIIINLALELAKSYKNINLIDCDERMKTTTTIMNLREKKGLPFVKVLFELEDIKASLEDKSNLNLYDLKGHIGEKEALILNKCDLIIVISSNEDLVLLKTLNYVSDLEKANLNYRVLINKFNDKLTNFSDIQKMFKTNLFNSYLKDKISYKKIDFESGELFFDKKDSLIGLRPTKIEFDNFVNELILSL